jgi:hypothetical protein
MLSLATWRFAKMNRDQFKEWGELRDEFGRMSSEGALLQSMVTRFMDQDRFDSALSILLGMVSKTPLVTPN